MKVSLKDLYKLENQYQVVLAVMFVIYLMTNMNLPYGVTQVINTPVGTGVIIVLALTLLYHSHPVVGVLGLLVAYQMIRVSGRTSPNLITNNLQPSFSNKSQKIQDMQPPRKKTLEEEAVENMVPLVRSTPESKAPSPYLPVLDSTHGASEL